MTSQIWFILVWLFVLGTIVGSFLNVVIYRLPLGLSLVTPGSRCPKCEHPIRWYDNIPILSWFMLRGHCRDCGAAISVRYPLVELAIGLMFLAISWTDCVLPYERATEAAAVQAAAQVAAGNVPDAPIAQPGIEQYAWRMAFHLLLLCTLFAAAMIDFDGHNLPRRLITLPSSAGILLAIYWPAVQAFPLFHSQAAAGWISLRAFLTSFVGMIAAFVVRVSLQQFLGSIRPRELGLWSATLCLNAVGAFLGWQAVVATGAVAIAWAFVRQALIWKQPTNHFRPTAIVFIATLAWCLAEYSLAQWVLFW